MLLLVATLCASASASPLRGHLHSRAGRKLLQCMVIVNPTYTPPASGSSGSSAKVPVERQALPLPLCATQHMLLGAKWVPVSRDQPGTGPAQATAADLAAAWHTDPENPRTQSSMRCSGEVDPAPQRCWAGNGAATGATFKSLSCCSNVITCFIARGGCVGK